MVEQEMSNDEQEATQEVNYIDSLLRYAIAHPESLSEIYFIKSLVRDVEFIIFYYIEEFQKKHASLTKFNIQSAMQSHKLDWVNSKSDFMKKMGGAEVSKAFIASTTTEILITPHDYANVLEKIVLQRYDEIMKTDLLTEDAFNVLKLQATNTGNFMYAAEIMNDLRPLLEGTVSNITFNKVRYGRGDVLAYMQARLSAYNQMLSPDDVKDYGTNISSTLANSIQALTPTFAFNLGRSIFTNPQAGFLVSVVAAEKLGKTRFVLGEMVFPTLMSGKNVLYLSGEMQPVQILSILLVKYMFAMKSIVLPEEVVTRFLVCINCIRQGIDTPQQRKYYDRVPVKIREMIILAEEELFYSGRYGKIFIEHISDKIGVSGKSRYFNIDEYFPLVRAQIAALPEEERYAMIVRDHVNHVTSTTLNNQTQVVTKYLQDAKTLATDKHHPLVYVVINHITTELSAKIEEQGNVDGLKLRGHNSNEEGKTADLQLFLYERHGQKREGQLTAVVENDRFCNMEQMFKTKEFILESRREVADFNFFGERKDRYPVTEDEFLDFLNRNQRGGDNNGKEK